MQSLAFRVASLVRPSCKSGRLRYDLGGKKQTAYSALKMKRRNIIYTTLKKCHHPDHSSSFLWIMEQIYFNFNQIRPTTPLYTVILSLCERSCCSCNRRLTSTHHYMYNFSIYKYFIVHVHVIHVNLKSVGSVSTPSTSLKPEPVSRFGRVASLSAFGRDRRLRRLKRLRRIGCEASPPSAVVSLDAVSVFEARACQPLRPSSVRACRPSAE